MVYQDKAQINIENDNPNQLHNAIIEMNESNQNDQSIINMNQTKDIKVIETSPASLSMTHSQLLFQQMAMFSSNIEINTKNGPGGIFTKKVY